MQPLTVRSKGHGVNPQWLHDVVYFARVPVAHVLLSEGPLSVIGEVWK